MKAIIKQVSKMEMNGIQTVEYDIVDKDGEVIANSNVTGDIDGLRDVIAQTVRDYELKSKSKNRLKEGDEIQG